MKHKREVIRVDEYQSDSAVTVRAITGADREWVAQFVTQRWGAPTVVGHGDVYRPHELPGFFAEHEGQPAGVVTYRIAGGVCEIVSIDSVRPGIGVGSALMQAVIDAARRQRCTRVWLITTNDNLNALRFYQKRGFALVAVHRNAVARSRQLKPEIPLIGADGIPIRDEIELELQDPMGIGI
jgi:DNA-3-methyladenine glycosylase I